VPTGDLTPAGKNLKAFSLAMIQLLIALYPVTRHGLGLAYEGLQLYPKAKAAVDEAVRLHPRHPFALCTLGDVSPMSYNMWLLYVISNTCL
jgi:hypothetical protein